MAKHLCIHKGHGRDAFGEVKRYLPSSKAKDNTKSFRVKLRLKSLVDWEKIQREADRVNEGKVKKDDAKLQTCLRERSMAKSIGMQSLVLILECVGDETLRRCYRRMVVDGAFAIVIEAWTILSDKAKRGSYEQRRGARNVLNRNPSL
nr:putative DnaJ domain-containing protein [Ipomoea batatas]